MSQYEIVAIVLSAVALLFTLVNIWLYRKLTTEYNALVKEQNDIARKQNAIAEQQNRISQGQAETEIRSLLMSARVELAISGEKCMECSDNNQLQDFYSNRFSAAQEDLRNAYEEACSRYLDGKADKVRFKRMYMVEIRNLVEDETQKEYFDAVKSRYKCILKVYEEWNNLEK